VDSDSERRVRTYSRNFERKQLKSRRSLLDKFDVVAATVGAVVVIIDVELALVVASVEEELRFIINGIATAAPSSAIRTTPPIICKQQQHAGLHP
jgi:hypothetical protein